MLHLLLDFRLAFTVLLAHIASRVEGPYQIANIPQRPANGSDILAFELEIGFWAYFSRPLLGRQTIKRPQIWNIARIWGKQHTCGSQHAAGRQAACQQVSAVPQERSHRLWGVVWPLWGVEKLCEQSVGLCWPGRAWMPHFLPHFTLLWLFLIEKLRVATQNWQPVIPSNLT